MTVISQSAHIITVTNSRIVDTHSRVLICCSWTSGSWAGRAPPARPMPPARTPGLQCSVFPWHQSFVLYREQRRLFNLFSQISGVYLYVKLLSLLCCEEVYKYKVLLLIIQPTFMDYQLCTWHSVGSGGQRWQTPTPGVHWATVPIGHGLRAVWPTAPVTLSAVDLSPRTQSSASSSLPSCSGPSRLCSPPLSTTLHCWSLTGPSEYPGVLRPCP